MKYLRIKPHLYNLKLGEERKGKERKIRRGTISIKHDRGEGYSQGDKERTGNEEIRGEERRENNEGTQGKDSREEETMKG